MFNLMPRRERAEVAVRNPLDWFRREFASLFDRAFPAFPMPFEPLWENNWGFEMETRENEYVVRAEVPGFEASELEVTFAGNMLTIRAEHKPVAAEKEAVERSTSRLERTMTLPTGINPEGIEARYHNGVLEVHVPMIPEATARRIEVKV